LMQIILMYVITIILILIFRHPCSQSSARRRPRSSAPSGSTFLSRLFHRNPSNAHDTSLSSPLDWARNLLKRHRQNGVGIELQGRIPAAVEVPYAKGKRVCILSSTVKRRLILRRETLQRGRLH
jgi:hypothetical protein